MHAQSTGERQLLPFISFVQLTMGSKKAKASSTQHRMSMPKSTPRVRSGPRPSVQIVEIASDEIEKEEKHRGPLRGLSTNYILNPTPYKDGLVGGDDKTEDGNDLHSTVTSNKENVRVTRTSRGELQKQNYDMQ